MPFKPVQQKIGLTDIQLSGIKNLIFDFGGVIIGVDYNATIQAFKDLGFTNFDDIFTHLKQTALFDLFETGKIPPQTFRNEIRKFNNHLSDAQIDTAWNAMIGPIPQRNVDLLTDLRKNYRTFLLSNTNSIHIDFVTEYLKKTFHSNLLDEMFDQLFLSFETGLRKPNKEAYQHVLDTAGISAHETLFIDDLLANVEGASRVGLFACQLQNQDLTSLFEP